MTLQGPPPLPSERKSVQCHKCGSHTTDSKIFVQRHKSFSRKTYYLCPSCLQRVVAKQQHRILLMYAAFASIGLILMLFETTRPGGWFCLNVALFFVAEFVSIVLHEAAHVAVAHAVGWKVFRVIIGFGKPVYERVIAGVTWQLNAAPFGGITFSAPENERAVRWKFLAIVSAGLPVHALLIFIAIAGGAHWPRWSSPGLLESLHWQNILVIVNAIYFLANITPNKAVSAGYMIHTDGALMLKILFKFAEMRGGLLAARPMLEAFELRRKKKYTEADHILREATKRFFTEMAVWTLYGVNLLDLNRPSEAGPVFREILAKPTIDDPTRALTLNNLAWVNLVSGDPTLLAEGDTLSAEAMEKIGWHPSVQGTRGSILIELGKVDDGLALVSKSLEAQEEAHSKALNACYVSIAHARKGDVAKAVEYRHAARALDPDCILLPRANAELERSSFITGASDLRMPSAP